MESVVLILLSRFVSCINQLEDELQSEKMNQEQLYMDVALSLDELTKSVLLVRF